MGVLWRNCRIICLVVFFCHYQLGDTVERKARNSALIVNGQDAREGQFPYAVSIQHKMGGGQYTTHCAAALITTKTCLGAAHCVIKSPWDVTTIDPNEICGVVGRSNLIGFTDCHDFSTVHRNGEYSFATKFNDVATYIFKEEIKGNENVKPIALIAPDGRTDGKIVTAMGWGSENPDQRGNFTTILKYVHLRILPVDECRTAVEFEELCLETNGKGTCFGDSGGPNVINHLGKDILVGVTSHGEDKGCANGRSISTDIRGYAQWIIGHSDSKPNFVSI